MPGEKLKIGSTLRRIITNAGWLFVLRVLRILWALFVSIWLARYLGPQQFGNFNYAIAFVALFGPLARMGLNGIVVRDIVREPERTDEILGTTFLLKLVGGITCFGVVVGAVSLLRPGDALTRVLVGIIAFGIIFQAFDSIDIWFQSQVQSKYVVYAKSTALILANLAKIVLILAEASLVAFAWVSALEIVAGAIGMAVVYRVRGYYIQAWRANVARVKSLLGQSWPMILAGVLAVVYLRIDQVMLGEMVGQREVGVYSTAVRISEVWYFVATAVTISVFPALVRSKSLGREIYEVRLQQLYDFLVWIALVVAVVLTFTSGPLVALLYGEEYSGGGLILAIHIWAGLFVFVREALGKWLINEGFMKFFLLGNGLGAAVNVLLNWFLIPAYGGVGAAVATVVSYAVAGYLACFIVPQTRSAGKMMSRALVVPFRTIARIGSSK